MKKVLKILAAIGGAFALLLAICALNHQFQLKREDLLYYSLGETLMVDGAQMSVYIRGEGKDTIVFMSGSGTCSPILDFKSLYSLLTDTCKIAVVEKFGYGCSDVTGKSRHDSAKYPRSTDASGPDAPVCSVPPLHVGNRGAVLGANIPGRGVRHHRPGYVRSRRL